MSTNSAGMFNIGAMHFNYTVAANGRVTLTGGSTPPVLYLKGNARLQTWTLLKPKSEIQIRPSWVQFHNFVIS